MRHHRARRPYSRVSGRQARERLAIRPTREGKPSPSSSPETGRAGRRHAVEEGAIDDVDLLDVEIRDLCVGFAPEIEPCVLARRRLDVIDPVRIESPLALPVAAALFQWRQVRELAGVERPTSRRCTR